MTKSIRENFLFILFLVFSVGYFSYNLFHPFLNPEMPILLNQHDSLEPIQEFNAQEEKSDQAAADDLAVNSLQSDKIQEFLRVTRKIELPKNEELKKLNQDEEMKLLLETAHQMLKLRQYLEKNEAAKELGFKFFLDCSLNAEITKSFRAQCWNQAQNLYFDVFQKELDPTIVPIQIHRMASR